MDFESKQRSHNVARRIQRTTNETHHIEQLLRQPCHVAGGNDHAVEVYALWLAVISTVPFHAVDSRTDACRPTAGSATATGRGADSDPSACVRAYDTRTMGADGNASTLEKFAVHTVPLVGAVAASVAVTRRRLSAPRLPSKYTSVTAPTLPCDSSTTMSWLTSTNSLPAKYRPLAA